MRWVPDVLNDRIGSGLQIDDFKPEIVVYVKERYWGKRGIWNGADNAEIPSVEWYRLDNRVVSFDSQESIDQFSSSFNVTFANEEGDLAPDNYTQKFPNSTLFRGTGEVSYAKQLLPNNEIRVYLGYGDQLIPFIHGYIEEAKMNADSQTLTVSCMTVYKKLIHKTVSQKEINVPEGNLFDVLKFIFNKAGVTLHGKAMRVPGTNEQWYLKNVKLEQGQSYDEAVRSLIDTTYHYLKTNFDGSCTIMEVPSYHPEDAADVIFDEGLNLTALDYTLTDRDVFNTATIKSGNFENSFMDQFLLNQVCLGDFKEEILEVPWADTYFKRKAVAFSQHLKNLHKWRMLNVGIMGDPRIECWDNVGVRERSSSVSSVFHVTGIQTSVTIEGFVQVLDLAPNYGIDTEAPTDLLPIRVDVDTIRLKIWDWDREDGDLLNIYCNGKVIALDYFIRNNATYVDIPLEYGNNTVVFEGVSCALGILTGRLQVLDTSNRILFDIGSLPDLTFDRTNCDRKTGVYYIRPAKTWGVSRVN